MRSTLYVMLSAIMTVACSACGFDAVSVSPDAPPRYSSPLPLGEPFTIAVLPDTQYYYGQYGWVFHDQTSWLVEHASALNVQLVLGVGDIVDGGGPPPVGRCGRNADGADVTPGPSWVEQWANAASAVDRLNGHIPFMFPIGNHDYDCQGEVPHPRTSRHWREHFGPMRYAYQPWWRGGFDPADPANFYNVVTLGGVDFLVVALEFYPRNSSMAWAENVVSEHAAFPTILVTHAYLYYDADGPGSARHITSGDVDSAAGYRLRSSCPEDGTDATCGNGNEGVELWQKLVKRHPNIHFVFSGHIRQPLPGDVAPDFNGVGLRSDTRADGSGVVQILANFQGQGRNGRFGNGFLRLYSVDPSKNLLSATTYSPAVELHPELFPSSGVPAALRLDPYNMFTVNAF